MIGICMTLFLIVCGFIIDDLTLRAAYWGVAALFYIGSSIFLGGDK